MWLVGGLIPGHFLSPAKETASEWRIGSEESIAVQYLRAMDFILTTNASVGVQRLYMYTFQRDIMFPTHQKKKKKGNVLGIFQDYILCCGSYFEPM